MRIAEGDQLANEQSQDYRLRFAEALPRTAETGLIFRLATKPGGSYGGLEPALADALFRKALCI